MASHDARVNHFVGMERWVTSLSPFLIIPFSIALPCSGYLCDPSFMSASHYGIFRFFNIILLKFYLHFIHHLPLFHKHSLQWRLWLTFDTLCTRTLGAIIFSPSRWGALWFFSEFSYHRISCSQLCTIHSSYYLTTPPSTVNHSWPAFSIPVPYSFSFTYPRTLSGFGLTHRDIILHSSSLPGHGWLMARSHYLLTTHLYSPHSDTLLLQTTSLYNSIHPSLRRRLQLYIELWFRHSRPPLPLPLFPLNPLSNKHIIFAWQKCIHNLPSRDPSPHPYFEPFLISYNTFTVITGHSPHSPLLVIFVTSINGMDFVAFFLKCHEPLPSPSRPI